jgi:hypothetical protein
VGRRSGGPVERVDDGRLRHADTQRVLARQHHHRHIDPATGANYTPVLVPTPESFASTSGPIGLADLQAAMAHQQLIEPGDPYLVEGYSQSASIAVDEKIDLLQAGQHPDVTFLLLGDPNRPDGRHGRAVRRVEHPWSG